MLEYPKVPKVPNIQARACAALAAAFLAAFLAAGCGADKEARRPRVPVTVAAAVVMDVPYSLIATGTVEALETAAVGSNVGGVVTRLGFREGSDVAQGQVLFELDPRPFRAAYEQWRSALARDRAQAGAARLDAERARALLAQELTSQADFEQRTATAEALAANVRADSAAMEAARLNLQYATIRAPIAGRTGRRLVNVGDYVKAATSEPLVTINRMNPVRVRFNIPQDAVPQLTRHRGTAWVQIRTSPADSAGRRGRLAFVDNAVDPLSGTLLLKGEFDNRDGRLMPGQFVDVRLVLYTDPGAIVVPEPAVTSGQQGTYVYVLNADSTVSPRPVGVARTLDELTIVSSGLKPGETVVTDGQLRLSPGARVVVRSQDQVRP
jgi:multidrug efflux system membrane fusion protein